MQQAQLEPVPSRILRRIEALLAVLADVETGAEELIAHVAAIPRFEQRVVNAAHAASILAGHNPVEGLDLAVRMLGFRRLRQLVEDFAGPR
jgi:hypothetical protein